MLRDELKVFDAEIASALKRSPDVVTKRHLEDARATLPEPHVFAFEPAGQSMHAWPVRGGGSILSR